MSEDKETSEPFPSSSLLSPSRFSSQSRVSPGPTAHSHHVDGDSHSFPLTPPNEQRPHTPEDQTIQSYYTSSPVSSPGLLSPGLPSPLGLFRVGISTSLLPLRRQVSSPIGLTASPSLTRDAISIDDGELSQSDRAGKGSVNAGSEPSTIVQDRRDVLLDRLHDLMKRLSGEEAMQETVVDGLHKKVDEMEASLAGKMTSRRARRPRIHQNSGRDISPTKDRRRARGLPVDQTLVDTADLSSLPVIGTTPRSSGTAKFISATSVTGEPHSQTGRHRRSNPPGMEHKVALKAEKLSVDLAAVFTSLKARQEESEHISEMLLDRAESAAKRIEELEEEVADLEDQADCNESELNHLRLRLKALEVMCYEYVPADADPELQQSIENWKIDWVSLRNRMSAKKRKRSAQSGN
ncbi:hypothetical protein VTK73DRAFT_19 [Phialemonium thermophilum]|uniref:Uncharacterized protein n=1 Tax=Phialemonium thermophilum TaxID=223376 RepID=A0ABR3Y8M7_9PEZI